MSNHFAHLISLKESSWEVESSLNCSQLIQAYKESLKINNVGNHKEICSEDLPVRKEEEDENEEDIDGDLDCEEEEDDDQDDDEEEDEDEENMDMDEELEDEEMEEDGDLENGEAIDAVDLLQTQLAAEEEIPVDDEVLLNIKKEKHTEGPEVRINL